MQTLPRGTFLNSLVFTNGQYILLHHLSFLNWTIVDLQYCVTFRCTAKWFSYICKIRILFWILFHYRLLQDIEYNSLHSFVMLFLCNQHFPWYQRLGVFMTLLSSRFLLFQGLPSLWCSVLPWALHLSDS